jgi:transcriptional regulator with XRE-family HTH domain
MKKKNTFTEIGSLLKSLRESKGMSIRKASGKANIHNGHLSQIESGKIKMVNPSFLYRLSKVYNCSYFDLMRVTGYDLPNKFKIEKENKLGKLSTNEERAILAFLKYYRTSQS